MSTFKLYFAVKFFLLKELLRNIHFYKNPRFLWQEFLYFIFSFFQNPYRTSRLFLKRLGRENMHVYGETPHSTLKTIFSMVSPTKEDLIVELGSGRGRSAFFLSSHFPSTVHGIEFNPSFVTLSKTIKILSNKKNLHFSCENFLDSPLPHANIYYLYGTALEEKEIELLANKLYATNHPCSVLTVSYPLCHYNHNWKTVNEVEVSFPWGKTMAYCNKKKEYC